MAETTATPAARKTTKTADKALPFPAAEFPAFEMPKFEVPKFDFASFPQVEVPAPFREFAEKGVAQMKAGYDKLKTAAEEATDVIEDTFETARAGATELNLKALEAVKTNTDATFGFIRSLMTAKTLAEAVELQSTFAKAQFEALTAQTKDFQETAKKVAEETIEPSKAAMTKTFKDLKVA
jgi:phasin